MNQAGVPLNIEFGISNRIAIETQWQFDSIFSIRCLVGRGPGQIYVFTLSSLGSFALTPNVLLHFLVCGIFNCIDKLNLRYINTKYIEYPCVAFIYQ